MCFWYSYTYLLEGVAKVIHKCKSEGNHRRLVLSAIWILAINLRSSDWWQALELSCHPCRIILKTAPRRKVPPSSCRELPTVIYLNTEATAVVVQGQLSSSSKDFDIVHVVNFWWLSMTGFRNTSRLDMSMRDKLREQWVPPFHRLEAGKRLFTSQPSLSLLSDLPFPCHAYPMTVG